METFFVMSKLRTALVKLAYENPMWRTDLMPLIKKAMTDNNQNSPGYWYPSKQPDRKDGAWEKLPEGWTEESLRSWWSEMVGDVEHPVSKCILLMDGKVDDPGAFCASAADQILGKSWRSKK